MSSHTNSQQKHLMASPNPYKAMEDNLEDFLEDNDQFLRRFAIHYQIDLPNADSIVGTFLVQPNRVPSFHQAKVPAALERHPMFSRDLIISRDYTLCGWKDPDGNHFRDLWKRGQEPCVVLGAHTKHGEEHPKFFDTQRRNDLEANCEEEADSVIAMYYSKKENDRRQARGEKPVEDEIPDSTNPARPPSPDTARRVAGPKITKHNVGQKLEEAIARISLLERTKGHTEVRKWIERGLRKALEDVEEPPTEPTSQQSKGVGKQKDPQAGSAQDPGKIRAGNTRKKASKGPVGESDSNESEHASEPRKPRSPQGKRVRGKENPEAGTSTRKTEKSRVDTEEKVEGAPRAGNNDDSEDDYFGTIKVRGLR